MDDPVACQIDFSYSLRNGWILCGPASERVFGKCLAGDQLDREVGDMIASSGPLEQGSKLFTYVRYNAELTGAGLAEIGCSDIDPEKVQKLDSIVAMDELRRIGSEIGKRKVADSHFDGFG